MPKIIENELIIIIIEEFFRPEYLKICIWLSLNKLIKKNWVDIKNINGNISNNMVGELSKERYKGNKGFTSISLKNSSSVKIFNINTKLKITRKTYKKDFKKVDIKYLI